MAANNHTVVFEYQAKDNATKVINALESATKRQQSSTEKLISKLKEEEIFRKKGAAALDIYRAKMQGATAAQQQQIAQLHNSINASKNYSQANGALLQQSRYMRGMFGQLGHQIQDVAVQLQMGTNGMIVFAQQGGQVASLLGPWGAIAGAIISVGGALYTYIKSSDQANMSGKQLEATISKIGETMSRDATSGALMLSDSFIQLARSSRDLAELQLRGNYIKAMGAVSSAQNVLIGSTNKLMAVEQRRSEYQAGGNNRMKNFAKSMGLSFEAAKRLDGIMRDVREGVDGSTESAINFVNELIKTGQGSEELGKLVIPMVEAAMQLQTAEEQARFLEKALADLPAAIDAPALNEKLSSLQKTIEGYEDQARATYLSARSMALYKAALDGANQADFARINSAFDLIEAEEAKKATIKAATVAYKEQQKAMKASEKVMGSMADGMADAIINANNMKDAFRSMAQSIVQDMLKIYLKQQILGLVGMFATLPTAMKYNTNMGSQQTLMLQKQDAGFDSFSGGGFTGFGARAGGLDGKGGFMAMLHPNETVVDHAKGQGMGESVVVNLNISTGVAQTVRAEMMNLMPAITQATKSAVLDARMRGGSYSKGLVGA